MQLATRTAAIYPACKHAGLTPPWAIGGVGGRRILDAVRPPSALSMAGPISQGAQHNTMSAKCMERDSPMSWDGREMQGKGSLVIAFNT